jgi:hypothetical protein
VHVQRAVIIVLMGIGSIAMWLVVPVLWIYIASQMVETSQPSLGPYLLILVAVPASMVVIGKALSALNRYYARVTGTNAHVRVQLPWHKSMRAERDSGHPRTVLDVVMVVSVGLALLAMAVWFFFFAGSSLPSV